MFLWIFKGALNLIIWKKYQFQHCHWHLFQTTITFTKQYARKMKCWSHFRSKLKYFVTACSHYIIHKKNSTAVVVIKQKNKKNHQMLKIFRIFLAEVCILLATSQKLSFLIINISSFRCSICRTSLRMSLKHIMVIKIWKREKSWQNIWQTPTHFCLSL